MSTISEPPSTTVTPEPPSSVQLTRIARGPSRERISDRVGDELTSAIRDLRLEPGALLSETDLSRRLGVSRTPLREAISRLVDRGLLSVAAQVGTRVSLIDPAEVEEAVFIRCALETAAFRQACEVASPDVTRLRGILQDQEQALRATDADAFFVTDESLHEEIFRLGGHPGVWQVVRRSKLQLDRMRRLVMPEMLTTRTLVDEHTRIVDLLEQARTEEGVALVTAHAQHVLTQSPTIQARHPAFFTD